MDEQAARDELKSLFRELVGLVDCLRMEEAAHHAESDAAARVREAREALERSLASHGLLATPATGVAPSHGRRESIRATKRFIATSGACRVSEPAKRSESIKATLMFGKR